MLLAQITNRLFPPLSAQEAAGIAVAILAGVLVLRWLLGPANPVSRRGILWALRGVVVILLIVILLNPVRVEQLPGPIQRPEVFYLLDTSASMQMGNPRTR